MSSKRMNLGACCSDGQMVADLRVNGLAILPGAP